MRCSSLYLVGLLSLAILSGCGSKRTRVEATGLPPKLSSAALLERVDRALYVPPSAELKGDARVSGGNFGDVKLTAIVRLRQDSAFWFTLRKFGFEGARGLVTADSIIVLNRLEREAFARRADDLPDGARVLPIDPTVANLTAAFGGAPIGDWRSAEVDRQVGRYVLTSSRYANTSLTIDGERLVPTVWEYRDGEQYGRVIFSDFRPAGKGQVFPYGRNLLFSDSPGDTTRVTFEFNSLSEAADLKFPISVPRDYKAMEF